MLEDNVKDITETSQDTNRMINSKRIETMISQGIKKKNQTLREEVEEGIVVHMLTIHLISRTIKKRENLLPKDLERPIKKARLLSMRKNSMISTLMDLEEKTETSSILKAQKKNFLITRKMIEGMEEEEKNLERRKVRLMNRLGELILRKMKNLSKQRSKPALKMKR